MEYSEENFALLVATKYFGDYPNLPDEARQRVNSLVTQWAEGH